MRTKSIGASALLGAVAVGGAAMYLLDPDSGPRRRGRVRDLGTHLGREVQDLFGKGERDLRHRAAGAVAELRQSLSASADEASDDVVVARVRAEIGRVCSHPHAVQVTSEGGRVTLSGPVLAAEADHVCECAASVRGVRRVEDRLERHASAEHVPALQGNGPARAARRAGARWSPARRLGGGAAGTALMLWGLGRRGVARGAMVASGAAVLARAVTDAPAWSLVGLGPRRSVELHKSLCIDAPVGEVFSFFADVENFPRFLQHVRQVRRTGEGRSHWVVNGPAGRPVTWDVEVTRHVPNDTFAWKTAASSSVRHAGSVRFEPSAHGTRIDMRVAYEPAAGLVGQAISSLLGTNPKRALDEDMLRFKSLLERGKTSAHGREVRRADIVRS